MEARMTPRTLVILRQIASLSKSQLNVKPVDVLGTDMNVLRMSLAIPTSTASSSKRKFIAALVGVHGQLSMRHRGFAQRMTTQWKARMALMMATLH
jgi:hypothetical protein